MWPVEGETGITHGRFVNRGRPVVLGVVGAFLLVLCLCGLVVSDASARDFPKGFLWGTATAGFQVEAGGTPSNVDRRSDWYAFTTDPGLIADGVVSGDQISDGPGFWRTWESDLNRARFSLDNNAIRIGIEWSRVFPRSTRGVDTGVRFSKGELRRLDRLANPRAVRRYRQILEGAQRRGLDVMLTLNHFTLPIWIHDPIGVRAAFEGVGASDAIPAGLERAGWLDGSTVDEFRKYAAYVAWKLGRTVDLWGTINEPLVSVSQGYVSIPGVTGTKAPAILSYPSALRAIENLGLANAAAYDAVHQQRRRAKVGPVTNLVDWRPQNPASQADVTAAAHADQIFNRAFLDIVVEGWYDTNANGAVDPGELRPRLADKADYLGVNHYQPGRAQALGAPISPAIPLFDFLPTLTYQGTGNPSGPICPTACSDFGWEIDPAGLRNVVTQAASYGKPVYVTENGIDDSDDDRRPGYLRSYLDVLSDTISDGVDVRGYFQWSLLDNYEWAEGFVARFGLYSYDPETLKRTMRPSARVYARIARTGTLPPR
jgi:beta-glucosidase/6-phospho-beta-glucosidase/beta-galactosidase